MSDNVSNLKKARPPWKRILALALLILLVLAAVVLIAFRDRLNPGALRRMRALRGARINSRRDGVRPACAEGRSASRRCAFESICHPSRGLLWEESGESIPKRLKTAGFLS